MELTLWSTWGQAAGAVVATVIVYVCALVGVRIAGRRTMAQISAYDVLVTIALGTALANTALPTDFAIADGLAVLFTLLGLQMGISALRSRFPRLQSVLDFSPLVVVRDGHIQGETSPFTTSLTEEEVRSELRRQGIEDLDRVALLILEPTGKFSVRTADREV